MKVEQSIELLNKSVADELSAVHQYMYFHFHLDDQGFAPLSMLFKRTAIVEMGHVEALAERILFLKGDVVMAASVPVETIGDPAAMLAAQLPGSMKPMVTRRPGPTYLSTSRAENRRTGGLIVMVSRVRAWADGPFRVGDTRSLDGVPEDAVEDILRALQSFGGAAPPAAAQ